MRVEIKLKKGAVKIHDSEIFTVCAEPNEHGDLVVYRNHANMLAPLPIASYAAGVWCSHETLWNEL